MVEIIPKAPEQQPVAMRVFFGFSVVALVVALGGFFLLMFLEGKNKQEAKDLNIVLATEKTQEQIALEQEVFAARSRLSDFASIVQERTKPLAPFVFLENIVHPDVVFVAPSIDFKSQTIQLAGTTSSFRSLEEQLLVFKNQEGVQVQLGALKLAEEGGADFQITVQFSQVQQRIPIQQEENL